MTASDSVKHTGAESTGARIKGIGSGSISLIEVNDDCIIEKVEIYTDAIPFRNGIYVNTADSFIRIDSCILHGFNGESTARGIGINVITKTCDIWNNLIYDIASTSGLFNSSYGIQVIRSGNETVRILNLEMLPITFSFFSMVAIFCRLLPLSMCRLTLVSAPAYGVTQ